MLDNFGSFLVKMSYKMGTDRPSSSKNPQLQTHNSSRAILRASNFSLGASKR